MAKTNPHPSVDCGVRLGLWFQRLPFTTNNHEKRGVRLGSWFQRLQFTTNNQGWPRSFGECSSNAVDPQIESLSPPAHYKLLVLSSNVRSTSPSAVSLNVGSAAIGRSLVNLILIKLAIQGAATPESDLSDQLILFSRVCRDACRNSAARGYRRVPGQGGTLSSCLDDGRSAVASRRRLEAMGRSDRAWCRAGGHKHRLGRVALRAGGHCPVRRGAFVAGAVEYLAAGILQPGDDAVCRLQRRAYHRGRIADVARACLLDGLYGVLDIAAIWPYNASNAAVPLAAVLLGHLPRSGSTKGLSRSWASRYSSWRSCP